MNNKMIKMCGLTLLALSLVACLPKEDDDDDNYVPAEPSNPAPQVVVEETSIAPSSTAGRPNNYLGCIETSSRSINFEVWDHGVVDGDIISLIANGQTIIDNLELMGSPQTGAFTLPNNGFNYLVYYAHNEGDISPNTGTLTLDDREFVMEADLSSNGYVDIVVTGYGVSCADSVDPIDPDPVDPVGCNSTGTLLVYTSNSAPNGNITVDIDGSSSILSSYYAPGAITSCTTSAPGAIKRTVSVGYHTISAYDSASTWPQDSMYVDDCGCSIYEIK